MKDYFEEMGGKLIKTISNGEESVYIYELENGDVQSSDGNFFSNVNDDSFDDALEEFECGWREVHWNREDWADWYGCDEDEVDDVMDDDIKDWY
jgi:hypothetical protein